MRTKKTSLIISLLTTLSLGALGTAFIATYSAVRAALTINDIPAFTYTDAQGNTFNCYTISGSNDSVAIGWGDEPSNAPDDLTIPDEVTHGEDHYDVVAIKKTGFRYCDFHTVTLPNTIVEIGVEAFAYCDKMESFTMPYGVTEILSNTFLDCRSMMSFLYYSSNGSTVVTNDKITSIGDHAFDSCVSLTQFECPSTLTHIGESAFQRCREITRIYLPKKAPTGPVNYITIDSYAFADCSKLVWVYFEENLQTVHDYAFVDCDTDMKFHYGYPGTATRSDPVFSTYWRRKKLAINNTAIYPIDPDTHVEIYQSEQYPGLKYTIENTASDTDVYLDSFHADKTVTTNTIKIIDKSVGPYAAIYQWFAPPRTIANYYDTGTGALEIPGSLRYNNVDYPLKVIKTETFLEKSEITSVKFNDGIVQICQKAFYKCTNITSLDFEGVTTLREISSSIFNDARSGTYNNVPVLKLPACVEYIGKHAFYKFLYTTELSFKTQYDEDNNRDPSLKVLGGYSFGRIGGSFNSGKLDITLPCTLNDNEAKKANMNFEENDIDWNARNYCIENWGAIGPYAFGSGNNNFHTAVKAITMEECTHAHASDMTYTCSLAPNAFARSTYLTRFVSNANLCLIGADAFKNCEDIREVFLTTTKAQAYTQRTHKMLPWGTKDQGSSYDQAVFSTVNNKNLSELVIYLDGQAPGNLNSITGTDSTKVKWNSESSIDYPIDYGQKYDDINTGYYRTNIPTFYDMDFDFDSGSILYWSPANGGSFLPKAPTTKAEYDAGVITFARSKNSSDYSVARYYFDSANNAQDEIDLTGITKTIDGVNVDISANIKTIGDEAFASYKDTNTFKHRGLYFILPDGVEKIGERAFYRFVERNNNGPGNTGVRIVTYKSGNTIAGNYSTVKGACDQASAANRVGYCELPSGLKRIEKNAFYNNVFGSVKLGASVNYIGKSAFLTSNNGATVRSKLSSITFDSNSYFDVENNGIYYKVAANKTLLYQMQNDSNTSLTIADGTLAVGMNACASTKYQTIKINEDLKQLYGGAFQNNRALTKFDVELADANSDPITPALKYIGGLNPNDEVWDSNVKFDVVDYRALLNQNRRDAQSRNSVFQGCEELATLNFTRLTNLEKIGHAAFKDCKKLANMTETGAHYKYYTYNSSTHTVNGSPADKTSGVLDLSACTSLKTIGRESFSGCSLIKYAHLPNTGGALYVGRDPETPWTITANGTPNDGEEKKNKVFSDNSITILIGDTASQACSKIVTTGTVPSHYSNVWFGSNTPYYHASSDSDLRTENTAVCYWTENPNDTDGYILFTDYANAHDYFTHI